MEIQALVAGTRPSSCWEKRYLAKAGGPVWVRVTLALLHDRAGAPTYFVNVIEDLTHQKEALAERQELVENLHQAQKMESLGTLSAGIAHDINNILAAILGLAEVLQVVCDPAKGVAGYLASIVRASERGRDLVKNLTAFARKGLKEATLLDLNQLVQGEIDLLRRTTLQKVEVRSELAPGLQPIMGESSAIAGALMNLCVNAVNAMPEGGTLTIRTAQLPDHWVELVVTDTGQGMKPEVLAKAVEPFFTTQPVGKGTGLGLTIAFAVLKAHGGTLEISSDLGKGTAVTMRFPGAAGAVDPVEARQPELAAKHPAKVLIVDDDDLFLDIIPQLLHTMGHQTEVARSGQEALNLLEGGLTVDLVVLDQNMPGLSGTATLKRIRERWPRLPVIIGTGYLDAVGAAQVAGQDRLLILHKPYTSKEIRVAIDEILAPSEAPVADPKPVPKAAPGSPAAPSC
jgi:signal transduction histidine kinase/ActR/RegA family two-component response regulator